MEIFLKITAAILIAALGTLVLGKHASDFSLMLTLAVCCMSLITAVSFLKPVVSFMERLVGVGQIADETFTILLKVAGIGFLSQIACMVCSDAGNQSLGKTLQFVTTVVILSLCIPLLEEILNILEAVLKGV